MTNSASAIFQLFLNGKNHRCSVKLNWLSDKFFTYRVSSTVHNAGSLRIVKSCASYRIACTSSATRLLSSYILSSQLPSPDWSSLDIDVSSTASAVLVSDVAFSRTSGLDSSAGDNGVKNAVNFGKVDNYAILAACFFR